MTKKLSFSLRWAIVFTVLVLFSFYSLAAYSLIKGDSKVYAENIKKDKELSKSDKFIAVENEDLDDEVGLRERHEGNFEKKHRICTINQSQLDTLKATFGATVKTIKLEHGQTANIAVISKNNAKKKQIYAAIGIDKEGKTCKIFQQNKSFFLFLLPGVS